MYHLTDAAEKITRITLAVLKRADRIIADRLTIMKTAYLIEREYYRIRGERLTPLPYYKYTYGPFNGLITEAVEKLDLPKLDDYTYEIYDFDERTAINDVTPEEAIKNVLEILKKTADSFRLVDYVHKLREVKDTPFGEEIKFSLIRDACFLF